MKYINKKTFCAGIAAIMVSCSDNLKPDVEETKPAPIDNMEYLNDYDALKTYVDRLANPNFKLGTGVTVSDYNNMGLIYRLVNSNYDEVVAGYAMKHGAVVRADGSLNLANVETFLAKAEAGGVVVYGHTLVWHANQNARYLNDLIAPEQIPASVEEVAVADFETDAKSNYEYSGNAIVSFTNDGEGFDGKGRALVIKNESIHENNWGCQFFLRFSPAMQVGETYELTMSVRADVEESIFFGTQAHIVPYEYKHWGFFGDIEANSTWSTFTRRITVSEDIASTGTIAFNLGHNATTYYFDNLSLKKYNFEGSGSGGGSGYALYVNNPSTTNGSWDVQSLYQLAGVEHSTTYELSFAVKGETTGRIHPELQRGSDYSSNRFGAVSVTTDWVKHTLRTNVDGDNRNRLIISYGEYAGKLWIDDVSVRKINSNGTTGDNLVGNGNFENGTAEGWSGWGNGATIRISVEGEGYNPGGSRKEKTNEEKHELISRAMETWIAGMMEVSGYVKAWDVVNEPMSDWPNPAMLKSGIGKVDMTADEFYWQDYLGKDYAVKAFNLARQYGNSGDILFINDYGLESESQEKCKGLIEYVKYIESQGAKVDGIGTQLHVTCGVTKIGAIREMFRNLAATGKLIKVSELDMGYRVSGSTENVKTVNMNEAQHKEMANFYEAIVKAYFELVPAAQRYGITHWSPLDSPENSYWRAGEPLGLWSLDYNRKHTYAGFANGLAGKDLSQ